MITGQSLCVAGVLQITMQLISPTSIFVTTILCIVTSAPSKKPASKGDICLNKCDSRNFQCSNECKLPISKNRQLLFDCVRGCKTTQKACVLECADEGGTEVKSTKQNGGGGEKEANRQNKTRPTKKQNLSRKKKTRKSTKKEKETGVEEPEYNIELNQSEPWWMGEHGGLGWLLELMEL